MNLQDIMNSEKSNENNIKDQIRKIRKSFALKRVTEFLHFNYNTESFTFETIMSYNFFSFSPYIEMNSNDYLKLILDIIVKKYDYIKERINAEGKKVYYLTLEKRKELAKNDHKVFLAHKKQNKRKSKKQENKLN